VSQKPLPKEIAVKKYGRHWAVYLDSELLVVAVYKKGAKAVKQLIEKLISHVDTHHSN
jgi:hypothetical protein